MMRHITNKYLATYIRNPFSAAWSKLSAIHQSKLNTKSEVLEDDGSEGYAVDTDSQQYLPKIWV